MTPDYGEDLLVRMKGISDGAIPSGNSVAMLNLLRLSRMTGNPELEEKAAGIERAFSVKVRQSPSAFTQFISALDFAEGPSFEVVIVGKPGAEDTLNMLGALRKHFIPNKVVLFRLVGGEDSEIVKLAGFTQHLSPKEGKATAYVCRDHRCEFPTTDIGEMLTSLNVEKGDNYE